MMGLVSLYERGLGVAQIRHKATTLYLQAAAAGNENAKNALRRLSVK
jgi:TPR repeat protein